jgi:signal peptidase I
MIFRAKKIEYLFLVLFLILAILMVNKMFQDKKYQESLRYFVGEGVSMEPTILNGEEIIVDPNKKPEINDIIVFRCEKCKIGLDDIDILTKRLIKENKKGCYWVEGDNKVRSYDSRDFGWLCSSEIEFLGVFIEKVFDK